MRSRSLLAATSIAALTVSSLASIIVNAATIGTGSVVGSGSLTTSINWNDTFPGTASGTINGIVVKARILPSLNMSISGSGVIDLGNLSSSTASSGSVSIEIGTNAANGASITAKSTNAGMTSTTNSGTINSLSTDGFVDSYKFSSTLGTTDSTAPGYAQSGALTATEINTTTANTIYSTNKPQPTTNVDDLTFTVSAQPNAQTPAGDYKDIVVMTVTGNF